MILKLTTFEVSNDFAKKKRRRMGINNITFVMKYIMKFVLNRDKFI